MFYVFLCFLESLVDCYENYAIPHLENYNSLPVLNFTLYSHEINSNIDPF